MERNQPGRPRKPDGQVRKQRNISVEDDLWGPFVALVGEGNASREIREYLAQRIAPPANKERAA